MPTLVRQLIVGLILSSGISYAAYHRRSLTPSGAVGAVLVGTAIFGFGGLGMGLTLITFFATSTLLSRFQQSAKEQLAAEKFDKGSQRDIGQALANAGAGSVGAILYPALPDPIVLAAFIGAMATVNADTWATELGVLSQTPPRLITSFKAVEVGTSGGVSVLGTLATLGGGALIGLAGAIFIGLEHALGGLLIGARTNPIPIALELGWLLPVAAFSGLAGSLFDSLLGATVQAIYYSPWRDKETEKNIDPNGKPNSLSRGWRWLNNDMVNFSASLVGALVGAGLALLFRAR